MDYRRIETGDLQQQPGCLIIINRVIVNIAFRDPVQHTWPGLCVQLDVLVCVLWTKADALAYSLDV